MAQSTMCNSQRFPSDVLPLPLRLRVVVCELSMVNPNREPPPAKYKLYCPWWMCTHFTFRSLATLMVTLALMVTVDSPSVGKKLRDLATENAGS